MNKKLGRALTWSVDALLQSGEGDEVEKRKREALECLAYVRDVLNEGRLPNDLDDDLLLRERETRSKKNEAAERNRRRVEAEAEAAKVVASDPLSVSTAVIPTTVLESPPTAPSAPLPALASISFRPSRRYPPTPISSLTNAARGHSPRPSLQERLSAIAALRDSSTSPSQPPTTPLPKPVDRSFGSMKVPPDEHVGCPLA